MTAVADLDPARIQRLLRSQRYGHSLSVRKSTKSTNDDAREALAAGALDGHTIVADSQTLGRGSRGRVWHSPAGRDLYVSIAARPGLPLTQLPPVTLAVGLGVAECVDATLGEQVAVIKWPNDVLLAGKKVAGVLVEGSTTSSEERPAVVIGVGLNVKRRQFPPGLDYPATSLALSQPQREFDRSEVLASLLEHIETWIDRLVQVGAGPVVEAVDARLALRGSRVDVEGLTGEVLGVAPDGRLRLSTDTGERLAASGRPVAQP